MYKQKQAVSHSKRVFIQRHIIVHSKVPASQCSVYVCSHKARNKQRHEKDAVGGNVLTIHLYSARYKELNLISNATRKLERLFRNATHGCPAVCVRYNDRN